MGSFCILCFEYVTGSYLVCVHVNSMTSNEADNLVLDLISLTMEQLMSAQYRNKGLCCGALQMRVEPNRTASTRWYERTKAFCFAVC